MSTLRAITLPRLSIDLDADNRNIVVYGFNAAQIGELYASYPELSDLFKEVKLILAQAKARKENLNFFELANVVLDRALNILSRGGIAMAVMYALREKTSTTEEWSEAFDAANSLPIEWQVKILSAAFKLTMPEVAANFQTAMSKVLDSLSENGIASKTGSDE